MSLSYLSLGWRTSNNSFVNVKPSRWIVGIYWETSMTMNWRHSGVDLKSFWGIPMGKVPVGLGLVASLTFSVAQWTTLGATSLMIWTLWLPVYINYLPIPPLHCIACRTYHPYPLDTLHSSSINFSTALTSENLFIRATHVPWQTLSKIKFRRHLTDRRSFSLVQT